MTEGGTAAQVPQEIARLARSHEEVSILFMDIVGETKQMPCLLCWIHVHRWIQNCWDSASHSMARHHEQQNFLLTQVSLLCPRL